MTSRSPLLIAMCVAALAGCAGSSDDETAEPATVETTPRVRSGPAPRGCGAVPAELVGRWTTAITRAELPPEIFEADVGTFVMTIASGSTRVEINGHSSPERTCVSGNQITWRRDDCGLGIYRWQLRDDTLALAPIRDECFWRPFLRTAHTWSRVRSDARPESADTCGPMPPELVGTYTSTLTAEDRTPEAFDARTGTFELTFAPDSRARLTIGGETILEGPTCVSGNRLSYPPDARSGKPFCGTPSVFSWTLRKRDRATELMLETVDACVYGVFNATTHPWRRIR